MWERQTGYYGGYGKIWFTNVRVLIYIDFRFLYYFMVSHAKLKIDFPLQHFKQEISSIDHKWIAHFNYMQYEGEWTALALRTPGGRPEQIIPDQVTHQDYANTKLLFACSSIQQWLESFQCPLLSVRLLNLKSNAIIKEHRDHELCFENGEARLHVPIFTNPFVEFVLNNIRVEMREGECWYINANLPHRVANKGTSDRIHLVVDCLVNDWLTSIFNSGEQHHAIKDETEQNRKIIYELRLQNTPISNQLADQLEKELTQHPG
jgi:mannose-6-phosphate isomerase-like protein (cupin superfamily)